MMLDPAALAADEDVLVVDDAVENLKFLKEVLTGAGLRVRLASDGELALRSVQARAPALILLDIRMPGMDGFEVCRRLKADPATQAIPVIFASALADTAERIRGFELGAVDYVTKPLNAQEVLLRVGNHLKLFVAQRRLEIQNARLREAEATARQAQEFAEAANRAKSTFLANMSHELHTPMNAIMGMTALALRRAEDPKLREQLGHIEHAAQHLLHLLDDILDITKLDAEHLTLEPTVISLDDLRQSLADTIKEASAKGLTFTLDLPAEWVTQPLIGDPARLGQILRNLAGNAVKFTAQGCITLQCDCVEDHPDNLLLRFAIKDTGIGIATSDQSRIFTPFVQVDASMTRAYGGTGLGLAISKRLVQLMGGEIGVESTPGTGSTFWFTVRLGKPQT